jgi:hypothetical protein
MLPQPPPMAAPPVLEPKRLKVFGVLHIVLGALGLVFTVLGLVMKQVAEKFGSDDPPEMFDQFQTDFSEAAGTFELVSTVLGVGVAVLMIVAGISLVRRRKNCLRLNSLYGWSSIASKVLTIVLFVMLAPALNEVADKYLTDAPPDVKTLINAFKIGFMLMALLGSVLTAIYPMLALILLNKPVVKDFVAQHGT